MLMLDMMKRSLYSFVLIVCLSQVGSSILRAQSTTLKQCSETLWKARQEVGNSRLPNQRALVTFFDPTHQKTQQIYYDWAECVKGHQIPLSSFTTLTGETYDTASLAGKILVVNFWFIGCAPCRAELPALNRLVEEYKDKNVLFLGFATDRADKLTPAFFQQNRFDFKIIADAASIARPFYINGFPTTYVVDQRGTIRQAWIGGVGLDKLGPYYKAKAAIDNLLTTTGK